VNWARHGRREAHQGYRARPRRSRLPQGRSVRAVERRITNRRFSQSERDQPRPSRTGRPAGSSMLRGDRGGGGRMRRWSTPPRSSGPLQFFPGRSPTKRAGPWGYDRHPTRLAGERRGRPVGSPSDRPGRDPGHPPLDTRTATGRSPPVPPPAVEPALDPLITDGTNWVRASFSAGPPDFGRMRTRRSLLTSPPTDRPPDALGSERHVEMPDPQV